MYGGIFFMYCSDKQIMTRFIQESPIHTGYIFYTCWEEGEGGHGDAGGEGRK